jgi:uncharacterized protein (TIGR00297 family)
MIANSVFKKILTRSSRLSVARRFGAPLDSFATELVIAEIASAGVVALIANRARLLNASGAVAAACVGTAALIGGARWVVMLLFFFATSNALSRWRARERDRLIGSFIEKSGRRDARQVLANGGVFASAAILATTMDAVTWHAVGIGAIAAATADTWSTEIGTVLGGSPIDIRTGRQVPPGTSGGITIAGSAATVVAASLVSLVAWAIGWSTPAVAIILGGLVGSLGDSLLGSTVQERRWCPACDVATERRTHSCGTTTMHRGGIRGCDNDIVNLLSTIAGAVVTWILR